MMNQVAHSEWRIGFGVAVMKSTDVIVDLDDLNVRTPMRVLRSEPSARTRFGGKQHVVCVERRFRCGMSHLSAEVKPPSCRLQ